MFLPSRAEATTALRIWIVLVLSSLVLHDRAAAQEASDERSSEAQYDQRITAALDDYQHKRYEEAKANFEAAHAIAPSARTLRGLGKVEFELRNYGDAVKHLTDALQSQVHALSPALREEVEELLKRGQLYVGQLHLEVQPDSATVVVDGVTVAAGPRAHLSLVVGDHVLELHARGRLPERRSIKIRGGEATNLQIILTPSVQEPAPRSEMPAPVKRDERRKRAWLWGSLGLVLVAVTVGIAVATTRDRSETKTSPPTGPDGKPTSGPVIQALELP